MSPLSDPSLHEEGLVLRAGDWVVVRSPKEILGTLDGEGSLDALPFMPEMLQHCGKRFRVYKSAHKACDTIKTWRNRRMSNAVHLDGVRCDGEAHGACQAGCLLYWKTAWLKPVAGPKPNEDPPEATALPPPHTRRSGHALDVLHRATRLQPAAHTPTEERYRCQATEMFRATTPARWDLHLYLKDITSRNVPLWDFVRFGLYAILNRFRRFPHIRGRANMRPWDFVRDDLSAILNRFRRFPHFNGLYAFLQRFRRSPHVRGRPAQGTPQGELLNLQPGDWVRVRSKNEILRTLNRKLRHRGLSFDIEMLPYCGRTFRVLRRVERLIDDRTGKMIFPRSICLILDGVVCSGCRSRNRMFCPRSIYPYWHEIWLERAEKLNHPHKVSTRT